MPSLVTRITAVDIVRGIVMVIMALDHTRDFFHFDSLHGGYALDLNHTSPWIFLTRFSTHFCAPAFVFLCGTSAYLSMLGGKSKRTIALTLVSRGLWLVLLELTVIHWFAWTFSFDYHHLPGYVIWAIGCSMIVVAPFVYLPTWLTLTFGIALLLGHNVLDGVRPETFGSFSWLFRILHVRGGFEILPGFRLFVSYPLLPCIGLMAAGFAFGKIFTWPAIQRQRWLFVFGVGISVAFVVLRFSNIYGNPTPWEIQRNFVYTLLSFLNCQKYPFSLCYVLMTIGPILVLMSFVDMRPSTYMAPLQLLGRVPLFYYILHLIVLHGLAVFAHTISSGRADFLYGYPPPPPPVDAGFDLPSVYLIWATSVILLYPICRSFDALKQARTQVWTRYL